MKRIALLTVLLISVVFLVPTYAVKPGPENGEPEPFQAYVSGAISGENFEGVLNFDVDPEKRLRIDNFTVSMNPAVGSDGCYIQIKTELNVITAYHRFPLEKVATMTHISPTYDVYMGGQEVCLYADPGSKVYIRFFRTTTSGATDVTFSVTGYLEPVNSF